MKNKKIMIIVAAVAIMLGAGSVESAEFGTEDTQKIIGRVIEANISSVVQTTGSDQTIFNDMQNRMMSMISSAIKQDAAARKRATVIETCMECRAMQPIKYDVSTQTALFDAETQESVNQAMAKKIKETIRQISSNPAVALSVQKQMMKNRMATNPLQQKMQPFIMSKLLSDPTMINVASQQNENTGKQLEQTTCSAGDAGFPNC